MMIRSISFLVLILLAVFTPWWLFALAVVVYGFKFSGLELVVLGVAVDSYYGSTIVWPVYTIICGAILLLEAVVRPYITF